MNKVTSAFHKVEEFASDMGNWLFGKKKPAEQQAPELLEKDKAVLDLKRQRDRLKKYQKQAEAIIVREVEIAKILILKGDKKKALLCLKKKKYQQSCIEKLEVQLLNLEGMVNSIEFASMQNEVFKALEIGKNALEELNSQMSLEDVEKLMDDTAEAIAYQEEIGQALGTALSAVDEDEIEAELAALEELEAAELAEGMSEAPTKKIKVAAEEEEEPVEQKTQKTSKVNAAKQVVLV